MEAASRPDPEFEPLTPDLDDPLPLRPDPTPPAQSLSPEQILEPELTLAPEPAAPAAAPAAAPTPPSAAPPVAPNAAPEAARSAPVIAAVR